MANNEKLGEKVFAASFFIYQPFIHIVMLSKQSGLEVVLVCTLNIE
jgi:hypothetical protein